jgi:phosphatidylinositol glycan class V
MSRPLDDDADDDSDCVRDAENTARVALASATRRRSAVSVAFGTFFAGREMGAERRRRATKKLRAAFGDDDSRWRPKMFARALNVRLMMMVVMMWAEMTLATYDTSREITHATATRRVDAVRGRDAPPKTIENSVGAFACQRVKALTSWDSAHFVGVSLDGYAFEHQHAFYPGYPSTIYALRGVARRALRLFGVRVPEGGAHEECLANSVAAGFNTFAFAASVEAMYSLSKVLLKDDGLSEAAAHLYALNPANVFYGAAYTESGYALSEFTAGALLQENRILGSGLFFGLATCFRSNGILSVVNVVTHVGWEMYLLLRNDKDRARHYRAASFLKRGIMALCLIVLPHYAFAMYGDQKYCRTDVFADAPRPYCRPASWKNLYGLIPSGMYAFLQKHYWNVGLFTSYRVRNLGNVLLGAPAILLGAHLSRSFTFSQDARVFVKDGQRVFVGAYFFKLGLMTLVAATTMHVQVSTRFLSTSPAMYWGLAYLGSSSPTWRVLATTYYLSFALVGAALFANFYPWT